MGVLEQVMQMQNQGFQEQDIISQLQQQGVTPKEISDAFNQSQIKNAISSQGFEENMQPSIMQQEENPQQQNYYPQNQAYAPQEAYQPPQPTQEYYPDQQNYYPEQGEYGQQQQGYENYGGGTTDTMMEIAEQVFFEKNKKITKQIEKFIEFQTIAQSQIISTMERLVRIENMIDKLQLAILDKVGSYANNLDQIKKEMSMMQDSFGKVVNQAVQGSHKKEI